MAIVGPDILNPLAKHESDLISQRIRRREQASIKVRKQLEPLPDERWKGVGLASRCCFMYEPSCRFRRIR